MRLRTLILLCLFGGCVAAQQTETTVPAPTAAPSPNPFVTLTSEFFEHDFVNIFAYGDGVLDTNNPIVTNTGQVKNTLGTGFDLGGGISLSHGLKDGELTFNYQGAWRDYQSSYFASGTMQNLGIGYTKRLSRHLTMNIGVSGGIAIYGGTLFNGENASLTPVITNPFSPETKYAGGVVSLLYQQTRRLSYSVFGNLFISRYTAGAGIGTTGLAGGASVNYRLTARDTISGSYSHSYFTYQQNAGQDYADQVGLGYTHMFNNHWIVSGFGGVARSDASGTVAQPVTLILPNGEAIGGYVLGKYNQTAFVPSYSGTVSHSYRRSVFSVSGGQGIAGSGNGYLLASRSIYASGLYSYSWRKQNIGLGGSTYRLTSIANTVSSSYSGSSFTASYGRSLMRFFGMFLRYDYVHYGSISPVNGVSDNRISFGFNFSSRSVPMTLF